MKILKGTEVSAEIKEQVTQMTEGLEGPTPKLTVVRVREKPDDVFYERGAVKKMKNFGLRVQTYVSPEQTSDSDSKAEFNAINHDPDIPGILLLRSLSKQIAETDTEKMTDPEKDLDGISPTNIAKVFAGDKAGSASYTTEAIIEVFKANEIDTTGRSVAIVGRSMMVGRPLSMLMLKKNATITICHTRTRDLETEYRRAEILVTAAGKAEILDGRHVGQGAIVIDVDVNMDENGELCGDADFPSIEPLAFVATPMLGSVGVMTTAALVKHLVSAGRRQRGN